MFSVQKKSKDNVSSIRPAVKTPAGRERLKHFDDEIGKAKQAVVELEQRIERCESIIKDADVNHRALQNAIEGDNGKSLADYSAGKVPDDSTIAKLVLAADNSGRAAVAARASLPGANAQLENAQAQILALKEERAAELKRVLMNIGDVTAREYQSAFDTLGRLHDELVGVASILEDNIGDIWRIQEPLVACRFAFPSTGDSLSDPFVRHRISDLTSGEAARRFAAIKARLEENAMADISDL